MALDPSKLPADASSTAILAERGLRMAAIDASDDTAVRAWLEADSRGFHDGAPTDESVSELRAGFATQRTVGVFDGSLAEPQVPIATVAGWPGAVSLPRGEAGAWAITAVTVAPTHRRRGIARAMLEGELRTAREASLPLAVLTVTEATIYGRYGFGPATWSTRIEADVARAGWVGADAPGRVQLVGRATAMATGRALFEEARTATPGDITLDGYRFERLFGVASEQAELRKRRFAQYDDEYGTPRGLAIYHLEADPHDFSAHTVHVDHLAATTDDAYRALWRHFFELDLVKTLKASLRSVDEPLRWLVRNPRAVRVAELREHLWARVLDAPAVLTARRYGAEGRLSFRVTDPLGYADGEFSIETDATGQATVETHAVGDGPLLELPVDLFASLLFGGVSAVTLAAAGRVQERTPGDAASADLLLRAERPPVLTTWF